MPSVHKRKKYYEERLPLELFGYFFQELPPVFSERLALSVRTRSRVASQHSNKVG
jgi:hypothetical protein